jgi:two-component system chemotaxis sensor kinase CheA
LLPTEIQRDNALLKAEYQILDNGKFMVILTNITEKRRMECLLESERHRLEIIVMAVSDSRNFFDTSDAFCEFLAHGLPNKLNGTAAPQILAKELYREIHTYKGVLNQFSFPTTPRMLHDIETCLSGLLLLGDTLTRQKIAELVSPEILQPVFDKDLAILSEALGKEFLVNREQIILSDTQAQQLEKLAKQLLRGETIDISVIFTLRKVSFRDVLMGFNVLVKQAAERVGKDVAPLEVIGGADVWINPKPYKAFFRSLVHVFRNAVAHGLATPDGRWEAEKDEAGKITCRVAVEGNTIKLVIADDGAGINLDALRERAVATGIYGAGEVQNVPDEEIARLIFMDNISTQKEVTELAGRGVGLAAVLKETKNLGGEVLVKTVAGGGTQFLFNLPLLQKSLHNEVNS